MTQKLRTFGAFLMATALAIAVGGLACGETLRTPPNDDESDGAT